MHGVSAGLVKSGAGIMTLTTPQFYTGVTVVNQGTLKLAGGTNTIFYNNDFLLQGGALDLNGTAQTLSALRFDTAVAQNANFTPGMGGTVINTSGTMATLGLVTGGSFSGMIGNGNAADSDISVVRATPAGSFGDWNIYSPNTYTGVTLLNGGRTQLLGTATFESTSAIEINQATLLISNNNATSILDQQVDNRINDAATILMRGGMLQYRARNGFEGTEAFGALTLAEGNSLIDVAEPGTGINSSTATFTSLTRQAGSRATLRFFNVDGAQGSLARVFTDSLNGFTTTNVGDGLTNHLIGGWAVFEREFASYTPGTGVGALNGVGYADYSPNLLTGRATVISSSTASTAVQLSSLPTGLVAGSSFLGSTLVSINGTTLTLAGNANADISAATSLFFNNGSATENLRMTFPTVASTGVVGGNLLTIASTAGLNVGDAVLGNGIPANATVASIIDGTQFTITHTLGAANPTLNLPQTMALTGDRTINSLAMVVSGDSTLDLGGFTLNLTSGGLIASQGFSTTNAQVTVVTSSTTSNIVELSSVPQNFVVGSTLLGRTVTAIDGLEITLDGNANTTSSTPTARDYVSGMYTPIVIQNGNLTAGGTPNTAADLYLHAIGYVNGNANVQNRDVLVGANIVNNGSGAVTLVINGTEGRGSFAGISDFRTNELVLTGNNTYTGGTTLNAGTLAIGHAKGLGTGNLTQTSGGSLLVIDTTGTLSNNMSVYNVRASQSATLGGAITVNNAVWDVDGGDTLTISGGVGGSGGVTKNGTGTLVLSGSNTYSGATVVNSGTLNAANANALGTNAAVTVNGGSLLVSADDAINGKNITLASTATGNGTAASLVFSGSYNGTAGSLTLNQDSIIDLGTDPAGVVLRFSEIVNLATYSLSIYNWTGTTLWGGTDRNNTDQFYVTADITSNLGQISFYSGIDNSSFLGTGYQLSGSGFYNNQVIPVPEPGTWATGILLIFGSGFLHLRRRAKRTLG
jgi:autotransporter-associated beta strand protein